MTLNCVPSTSPLTVSGSPSPAIANGSRSGKSSESQLQLQFQRSRQRRIQCRIQRQNRSPRRSRHSWPTRNETEPPCVHRHASPMTPPTRSRVFRSSCLAAFAAFSGRNCPMTDRRRTAKPNATSLAIFHSSHNSWQSRDKRQWQGRGGRFAAFGMKNGYREWIASGRINAAFIRHGKQAYGQ